MVYGLESKKWKLQRENHKLQTINAKPPPKVN